jgi:hypothetical protein
MLKKLALAGALALALASPVAAAPCAQTSAAGFQDQAIVAGLNEVCAYLQTLATGSPSGISTVKIDQTTPGTTNGVQVNAALPAGANIVGKVGIDQTTPGTTNKVDVGSFAGTVTAATTMATDGNAAAVNALRTISFGHVLNGSTWDRVFTCTNQTSATVTAAATTQLVALSGSTNIRVCSYQVGIATTGTFKFVSGTGSNCGTGTADLTPATTLTAGNVVALSAGNNSIFRAGASNALCLAAVTGNVQVFVSYAQF